MIFVSLSAIFCSNSPEFRGFYITIKDFLTVASFTNSSSLKMLRMCILMFGTVHSNNHRAYIDMLKMTDNLYFSLQTNYALCVTQFSLGMFRILLNKTPILNKSHQFLFCILNIFYCILFTVLNILPQKLAYIKKKQ